MQPLLNVFSAETLLLRIAKYNVTEKIFKETVINKIKNFFVPILLVVVLLCAFILPFGLQIQQANATEPENGARYSDTIYYFFDYYPEIRYSEMETRYTNHNIVYDRNPNCYSDFANYGNPSGYFDKFDSTCMVIIDIKTFMPEPQHLLELFSFLKAQGCQTMFLSIYEEQDFHDRTFLDYVDEFTKTDFSRLIGFIDALLDYEIDLNNTLANTAFFIDGNFVDVHSNHLQPAEVLYQQSIFLRIFLEKLYYKVDADEVIGIITLEHFLAYLDSINISIFVHDIEYDTYVNIFDGHTDAGDSVGDYLSRVDKVYNRVCSIGLWALPSSFYWFLHNSISLTFSVTNYVMEADPIVYEEGGLPIITDKDLLGPDDNEEEALAKLQNIFPA